MSPLAFVEVERCAIALCQYDATNMISWIIDSTKPKKTSLATSSLVET